MFTLHRFIPSALSMLLLVNAAFAQEPGNGEATTASLVTASASNNLVRFVSSGTVVQQRLEVYDPDGQRLLDTGFRRGNVLDWRLDNGAGRRLPSNSYACVLTSKSLSGRLVQVVGLVKFDDKAVAIEAADETRLTAAQQQAIGPLDDSVDLAILHEHEPEAVTSVAHNGADGQIARTSGALSFRVGDFFSGNDHEQMRLTEAGQVGIGTANPQAKLDVAGTIRAERVLITRPGLESPDGAPLGDAALIAGSGTQGRIAKWTDNFGTLGDSVITESPAGMIGIGTTNPQSLFHLGQNPGYGSTTGLLVTNNLTGGQYNRAFQLAPRQTAGVNTNSIMMYALPTVDAGVTVPGQFGIIIGGKLGQGTITSYSAFSTSSTSLGATNNTHLLLGTSMIPSGNFAVYDNTGYPSVFKGNVGIGTSVAQAKLDVRGDIRMGNSGQMYATGGDENLRVVRGVVDTAGNILAGSGFAVFRTGRGQYTITFTSAFSGPPAVTANNMLLDPVAPPTIIAIQATTATSVLLRQYCNDPNVCGDGDAPFHFIAIGPR